MNMEQQKPITIALSRVEALILFEFLSRNSQSSSLEIIDQAEQRVLWNVRCRLEERLVEPFMPNYTELLEKARDAVRDREE